MDLDLMMHARFMDFDASYRFFALFILRFAPCFFLFFFCSFYFALIFDFSVFMQDIYRLVALLDKFANTLETYFFHLL